MMNSCYSIILLLLSFFSLSYATYDGNYALSFDGKNDIVTIGHQITDSLLDDFWTVEAWIKAETQQNPVPISPAKQVNIIEFPYRAPSLELCCGGHPFCVEGTMLTQLRDANGKYDTIYGRKKVNDNQWHHVAATWSNETLSLYVDGVLDMSTYPYADPDGFKKSASCNDTCLIGFQIGGVLIDQIASEFFYGLIDEVRVWSVARTAQQINDSKSSTLLQDDDLLYYWRFDEGFGIVVESQGQSEAPGTLGAGIQTRDPIWIKSSSPISLTFDPTDSVWTPQVTRGAFAGFCVVFISFMVGFISALLFAAFAPKLSFFKDMFDRHNQY